MKPDEIREQQELMRLAALIRNVLNLMVPVGTVIIAKAFGFGVTDSLMFVLVYLILLGRSRPRGR